MQTKYFVWKYYLSCLIRDREEPNIAIAISQPLRLWSELNYAFVSSNDTGKRGKILKAQILLYRHYFHSIREIQMIPYYVNLFKKEEYFEDRFDNKLYYFY